MKINSPLITSHLSLISSTNAIHCARGFRWELCHRVSMISASYKAMICHLSFWAEIQGRGGCWRTDYSNWQDKSEHDSWGYRTRFGLKFCWLWRHLVAKLIALLSCTVLTLTHNYNWNEFSSIFKGAPSIESFLPLVFLFRISQHQSCTWTADKTGALPRLTVERKCHGVITAMVWSQVLRRKPCKLIHPAEIPW